jgi:hypothetical protein
MRTGRTVFCAGKAWFMQGHPDVQAAFAVGLLSGAVPDGVTARNPDEVQRRFNVYRNNVSHSLTAALATKFPVIARLVGDAFFAQMARVFADTHRPQSPVLMLWGDAFPDFLAQFPPLAGFPYMADVARIEVARGVAYHAADMTPMTAQALQALAAAGGDDTLPLHPSVQVLVSDHPVVTLWRSHQPGQTPVNLSGLGPECALILRDRALDVAVHAISRGDATMIAALQTGATLLDAAGRATANEPAHDPSPLLALMFQTGALIAAQTTEIASE